MNKRSGQDAVLQMRDEFLEFVAVANKTGDYRGAMNAQALAIALHKFEEDHNITNIVWPPMVINCGDGLYMRGMDDDDPSPPLMPAPSPNDAVRWICPKCSTVNGIDDPICLGGSCGTPRPETKWTAEKTLVAHRFVESFKQLMNFYTGEEAIKWLQSPQKLFDDRTPADLLLTQEGAKEVATVLAQLNDSAHV